MIGYTNSTTESQQMSGEYVNIRLLTNQLNHGDLIGTSFTLSYNGYSEDLVWDSQEVSVLLPTSVEYTISFSDVDNYRTPESVTYVSVDNNARTVEALYQTELLTVNVSADSGDMDGHLITISKSSQELPPGYIELEYVESTGEQYIDTGFKPNQDTRIVIDADFAARNVTQGLFGYATSLSSNRYEFLEVSKKFYSPYNNGAGSSFSLSENRILIDKNKNTTSVNGTTIATNTYATFQAPGSMYLFARFYNGGVSSKCYAKVYSCRIYDNGTIVRDYVPVMNTYGIAGLYDKVNNVFYSSASSVALVSGPTVTEIIGTQTTLEASYKIPFGTKYVITASNVRGLLTPAFVSRTANERACVVNMKYKDAYIDLSKKDVHGNTINLTTANCYVVSKPGDYKIPLVYGCALKNGSVNPESYTNNGGNYSHDFVAYDGTIITTPYIEDLVGAASSAQLSIADTDEIFTDINIINGSPCRYIVFSVANVPAEGANGIISIKDSNDIIMWNWHIWVWPHDLTPVEIVNNTGVSYNIMPVNLATKLDDGTTYGTGTTGYKNWFYQFGRPTPLLCPSAYNSTDDHASYGALSFTKTSIASNLLNGIQNPTTFYKYGSSYNNNWFSTNSDKTYNLWDAGCSVTGLSDNYVVKTVYDPCPVGFKIPNGNTFTGFTTSGINTNSVGGGNKNVVGTFDCGYKFKRYEGDAVGIFFPASGRRYYSNGNVNSISSYGCVWLSNHNSDTQAYNLTFNSSNVLPITFNTRSYGLSIRPVEDDLTATDTFEFTFDIGSIESNTAKAGMTWREWINSSYNTNIAIIVDNLVVNKVMPDYKIAYNGVYVIPDDPVLAITYELLT